MQELEDLKRAVADLEKTQEKVDKKIKDAAAYKEINGHLIKIIKLAFCLFAITVIISCFSIIHIFKESQNNLYDFFRTSTIETTAGTSEMSVDGNGAIFNDITDSSITQDTPTE